MSSKIFLLANNTDQLNNFLSKFYNKNFNIRDSLSWKKNFSNPVEMSELIAAFIDNTNPHNIAMWITLDKDVFVKISSSNANTVIKYLFERFPY